MAAFDLALASAFRDIEFDVHLSSDGVPVVIHDPTVNRTTDGTGKISKMPISVIRELDAGSWFSPPQEFAFQNEKVPEPEEVLLRYHGLAHLYTELKSEEPELVENVHYLLEHTGWLKGKRKKSANDNSSLWIISFNLQHSRDRNNHCQILAMVISCYGQIPTLSMYVLRISSKNVSPTSVA